jgi:hypothetical protein
LHELSGQPDTENSTFPLFLGERNYASRPVPYRLEAHPLGQNFLEKIQVHYVQNGCKSMKSTRRYIFLLVREKTDLRTSLLPNV